MSQLNLGQPQPIAAINPAAVFDVAMETAGSGDITARTAFLQRLGAKNAYPPLPHSPCLKNKKTGVVLPWNELLAEQQEFFDCCDEHGNTDPEAWQDKVLPEGMSEDIEQQVLAIKENERRFMEQQNNQYTVQNAVDLTPRPEQYPGDIVPFDQVESLLKQMES